MTDEKINELAERVMNLIRAWRENPNSPAVRADLINHLQALKEVLRER